ncbi:hypothetical protein [Helicobacter equorum]|uniref:hypothetical protein n=1 Tax=Helicobacter equorum TaxID=361872 RepID=UPI000CF0E556|nr:hypothetical protein [Helicobacter equorum]
MDTLSPEALFILVSFFFTFLFGVIVLLYLFGPTPKKVVVLDEETPKVQDRLKAIMEIVDNPKSDTKALQKASNDFFTYYDEMELSDYKKKAFLFALVVHKHTTHEIIINADTLLRKFNPNLEYELTKTLNRALDARGI